MNAATEFDLGPLTWVKGEIDLALERAEEALGHYVANADVTQLKFCRTHVHQVHGALSMVGLDGVTQVTESLESLLDAVEDGRVAAGEPVWGAVRSAMLRIRAYLDELMAGEPNQPLRLLPVYLDLAAVRGIKTARASDLFFPDLSLRPRSGRQQWRNWRLRRCDKCSRSSGRDTRRACSVGLPSRIRPRQGAS